jgi:hypothetical protein
VLFSDRSFCAYGTAKRSCMLMQVPSVQIKHFTSVGVLKGRKVSASTLCESERA